MPIERKHRLPPAAYYGQRTVAFTVCTEDRRPFLSDPQIASEFVSQLQEVSPRYQCLVPIYCFMPDHLHVMVKGTADASWPKAMLEEFKWLTGMWLSQFRGGLSWRGNYYDHLIRKHDDWKRQAFYILNNPVRKVLVEDPFEYPFTGSIGYDLKELFDDLRWS